jgi:hypothetical protein
MVSVSKVGTPADNQVGVWTGDGTIEGTAGLTFDGDGFIVTRVDAGSEGPSLQIYHDSATPASLDYLGDVSFYGRDGAANKQYYGGIEAYLNDPTSTSEDSWLRLNWQRAGAGAAADFGVDSSLNAMNGMTLGANGVDAIIQSKGNADLILRTGNATTGNITITDGADGLISLTPNGTGAVAVSTTLELGHATDTTISRVSAGVIAVEGATILTQKNLIRYVQCALNGTTALTTSEKAYFRIPAGLTGMNLVSVAASVGTGAAGSSSSGTPTFTVRNVTDNSQMLSTSLTVDANEYTSADATAAAVIDTGEDDVVTDDLIEVAVTTAGTGVTYATVTLGFQLP